MSKLSQERELLARSARGFRTVSAVIQNFNGNLAMRSGNIPAEVCAPHRSRTEVLLHPVPATYDSSFSELHLR